MIYKEFRKFKLLALHRKNQAFYLCHFRSKDDCDCFNVCFKLKVAMSKKKSSSSEQANIRMLKFHYLGEKSTQKVAIYIYSFYTYKCLQEVTIQRCNGSFLDVLILFLFFCMVLENS